MTLVGFDAVVGWEQLPSSFTHLDVSGLGVDSEDRVYVLTRKQARVIVYSRDGSYLSTFGEGLFTERTHGLTVGPDDSVYCVDDGNHTVRKFTPAGQLVMTLGTSGSASDTGYDPNAGDIYIRQLTIARSGPPFNKPTNIAVSLDGELYVCDGYGNARVHRYTADGRLLQSWGEPGSGPGQFRLPHGIWVTDDGRVLVADRENDRLQVFDRGGQFAEEWTHLQRPSDVCMDRAGLIFVSEMTWLSGQRSFRRGVRGRLEPGAVSVLDRSGRPLERLGTDDVSAPGSFFAPHALCVDSRGDIYVGEVSHTLSLGGKAFALADGHHSLQKLARRG